jgi:hypothetical protein
MDVRWEMHIKSLSENLVGKHYLGDLGINGMMVLNWILRNGI